MVPASSNIISLCKCVILRETTRQYVRVWDIRGKGTNWALICWFPHTFFFLFHTCLQSVPMRTVCGMWTKMAPGTMALTVLSLRSAVETATGDTAAWTPSRWSQRGSRNAACSSSLGIAESITHSCHSKQCANATVWRGNFSPQAVDSVRLHTYI